MILVSFKGEKSIHNNKFYSWRIKYKTKDFLEIYLIFIKNLESWKNFIVMKSKTSRWAAREILEVLWTTGKTRNWLDWEKLTTYHFFGWNIPQILGYLEIFSKNGEKSFFLEEINENWFHIHGTCDLGWKWIFLDSKFFSRLRKNNHI